jgi:hypothetical protein
MGEAALLASAEYAASIAAMIFAAFPELHASTTARPYASAGDTDCAAPIKGDKADRKARAAVKAANLMESRVLRDRLELVQRINLDER